jgi:hypothetical protein
MSLPKRQDRVHGWKADLATQLQSRASRDSRLKETPDIRYLKNLLSSKEFGGLLKEHQGND